MRWFIRGGLAGAGLLLGVLAGLIFGWVNNPLLFRWSANGAAAVLSLLAVVSSRPLKSDKIFWNLGCRRHPGFPAAFSDLKTAPQDNLHSGEGNNFSA